MKFTKYLIEEKEKEVIMLIGLPGTGKSTYINKHLKDYTVVSNDHIVEQYAKKKGITYTEAYREMDGDDIKKEFLQNLSNAIKTNDKIIIDNTNLVSKGRMKILSHFDDTWKKIALVFDIDPKELRKRLDKRGKDTGKIIPQHVIDDMIKSYENPTKREFDIINNI